MRNQKDTRTRILDAAENLFAVHGFHGTSLRDITRAAGVNLAAVNYHFGSKDALFEEVFLRRFRPINAIRRDGLEKVREQARRENVRPAVREVLHAFIFPILQFRETEPGAATFVAFVIRTMSEHDDRLREILIGHFRPTFFLCLEILSESLPRVPRDVLFWRLQFAIGAMSHSLHMLDVLPAGEVPVFGMERMTEMILSFLTAGVEGP